MVMPLLLLVLFVILDGRTKAQGTKALGITGTLGADLGGRKRLSKPRSVKYIDEIKWSSARIEHCFELALNEVIKEFSVPSDVEEYYSKMFNSGKQALVTVTVIHSKIQDTYDARMSNLVKRQNKKNK